MGGAAALPEASQHCVAVSSSSTVAVFDIRFPSVPLLR